MPNLTITAAATPRFDGDFAIVPSAQPSQQETDHVAAIGAALTGLAADEARDVAAEYPPDLLAARRAARAAAAAALKADAQKVVDDQLAIDVATARVRAVLDTYTAGVPKFGLGERKPARFEGDLQVVLVPAYQPAGDEKIYLDHVQRALDEFAADASKDSTGFSPGVIDFRKRLRRQTAKELSDHIADLWAARTQPAHTDIVLILGGYQALRDRLTRRLFNVNLIRESDQGPATDVRISLLNGLPPPEDVASTEKQDLLVQISKTGNVIQTVCQRMLERAEGGWRRRFKRPDTLAQARAHRLLNEYMVKLAGIARMGLEDSYTPLAKLALAELRSDFFTREAGRIKNKYVRWLGFWAGLAAALFLALYILVEVKWIDGDWWRLHKTFLLAACGASIGAWTSFSVRQVQFAFDDLVMLEEDALDPPMRVIFVVVLTLTACLLFWTGAVNIEIGDLKTRSDTFRNAGSVALLIGMFAGLSERALATAISGRAAAFVKGVAGGA